MPVLDPLSVLLSCLCIAESESLLNAGIYARWCYARWCVIGEDLVARCADGPLSEEQQRVAAGLLSAALAAEDSLMQLSSFLSFESEGERTQTAAHERRWPLPCMAVAPAKTNRAESHPCLQAS